MIRRNCVCMCERQRDAERQSPTSTIFQRKPIDQFLYDTYKNHMKAIFRKLVYQIWYISSKKNPPTTTDHHSLE